MICYRKSKNLYWTGKTRWWYTVKYKWNKFYRCPKNKFERQHLMSVKTRITFWFRTITLWCQDPKSVCSRGVFSSFVLIIRVSILVRCLQGKSWLYKVYLWKWSFLSFPLRAIWPHYFFDTMIVHYFWFNFALGLNNNNYYYTCIFLWFGVTINNYWMRLSMISCENWIQ